MRALVSILLLLLCACASQQRPSAPEKLYFALEMRQDGRLVGKPKLLGETGKVLRAEKRQPGSAVPDYQLVLTPVPEAGGDAYKVQLDVSVPQTSGHSELELLHGEVRKVEMGKHPGTLEIKLLLMKVDSPEFKALMELAGDSSPRSSI